MELFASFSEAIREGAKTYAPARGPLVTRKGGKLCGACAVGSALLVMGLPEDVRLVADIFPYMRTVVPFPVPGHTDCSLLHTAIFLFEIENWSRERIADWLESEEEKLGYVTVVESKQSVKPELSFVSG